MITKGGAECESRRTAKRTRSPINLRKGEAL
jgi:hypothetical protein